MRHRFRGLARLLTACLALLLVSACARKPESHAEGRTGTQGTALAHLGYTIQAGAFSQPENAARLSETLQAMGLNAVYYASAPQASNRLYRVRFGDFPSREAAKAKAEALRRSGVIQEFYIVAPEEPPMARPTPKDERGLRANLVETAGSYLGVPYLWGGTGAGGFDCSGLTMAVYRLNGLQMPRNSREQYASGAPVPMNRVRPGDLLFFTTDGSGKVSHVGIYIGGDSFIHAPKHGRKISKELLAGYYRERLLGARTYL